MCIRDRGWVDHFDTWTHDLKKRLAAQPDPANPDPAKRDLPPQDIPLALTIGALLVDQAAARATQARVNADAKQLKDLAASLRALASRNLALYDYPLTPELEQLVALYPDLSYVTTADCELPLWVDRERARFSAWYELFPRSTSPDPARHGTLRDVELLLPEIAAMGFDILYLPPIHPIGRAFRKGCLLYTSRCV